MKVILAIIAITVEICLKRKFKEKEETIETNKDDF